MQGCWHSEQTVITNSKIQFKHQSSPDYKPDNKFKDDIYKGKSIIPPAK